MLKGRRLGDPRGAGALAEQHCAVVLGLVPEGLKAAVSVADH
jgi:hypothetical protein